MDLYLVLALFLLLAYENLTCYSDFRVIKRKKLDMPRHTTNVFGIWWRETTFFSETLADCKGSLSSSHCL